jgi:hypothetical protein
VAAIELLLKEGLGRAPQAAEPPTPRLPDNADAVKDMPWEEMQLLFASLYVDEIAAVLRGEGRALLRERLIALSDGERRILRETLAELRLESPLRRRISP